MLAPQRSVGLLVQSTGLLLCRGFPGVCDTRVTHRHPTRQQQQQLLAAAAAGVAWPEVGERACAGAPTPAVCSTSAALPWQSTLQSPRQLWTAPASELVAMLRACSTVVGCMALCAVWASMTSSAASGPLLASVSLGAGATTFTGAQASARSAWTGLAAGALHTLCGPDHLAALTPLTIGRNRVAASVMGALWGFGHCTGQACLGLAFVLLKERFHEFAPALTRWSGTIVGLTLLFIGASGIYESHFAKEEVVEEAAGREAMALAGAGGPDISPAAVAASKTQTKTGFATYVTGIVYGLQPDALFVIVPALALPTKLAATMYCLGFVLGTVGAMGGYTLIIGTTSQALVKRQPWLQTHLSTIASVVALAVGIAILLSGIGLNLPFLQ